MSEEQKQMFLASGKLLSITEAAKLTPYSQEYMSLLARKGRFPAVKISRDWLTTREAVLAYVEKQRGKHENLFDRFGLSDRGSNKATSYQSLHSKTGQAGFAGLGILLILGAAIAAVSGFLFVQMHNGSNAKVVIKVPVIHMADLRQKIDDRLAALAAPFLVDVPDYSLVKTRPHLSEGGSQIGNRRMALMPRGPQPDARAPQVLGVSTTAALPDAIRSFITQTFQTMLAQGLFTGPKGDTGASGLAAGFSGPNGMVQNGNGQTTSVIGGTPIVSYIPASQGNGNYTGGSLAGFTNLSGQNLVANTENVTGNLTVQGSSLFGSATFSGSASVAGTFSAATSTFSTLTVSGPATFSGSTTIVGLTVTGLNPGLTLGSVAFQGASGLSQDNANFFYDSINHRLGIGTTSPAANLHVIGPSACCSPAVIFDGASAALRIRNKTSPRYRADLTVDGVGSGFSLNSYDDTNNVYMPVYFDFGTNFSLRPSAGTAVFTVLSSGNVGIGTTSPATQLEIAGDGTNGSVLRLSNAVQPRISLNTTYAGSKQWSIANEGNANGLRFMYADDAADTNATYAMVMTGAGNVGIGTGSGGAGPTANLQVAQGTAGAGTVSNGAGGTTVTGVGTQFTNTFKIGDTITIGGQTVAISAIASNTSMTTAAITSAHASVAYTLVGGTRFSVLGNGNVGIGTTTPPAKLAIQGTFGSSNTLFSVASTTSSGGATSPLLAVTPNGAVVIGNAPLVDSQYSLFVEGNAASGRSAAVFLVDAGSNPSTYNRVIQFNNEANNNTYGGIFISSNTLTLTSNGNENLAFHTNGSSADILFGIYTGTAMIIKSNTGNVGIGTSSPGSLLTMQGTSSTASLLNIASSSGNSVLFIANNGNVGIGTTSPAANLTIISPSASIDAIYSETPRSGGNRFARLTNTPGGVVNALQVESHLGAGFTPLANSGAGISFNAPDSNNNIDQAAFLSGILTDITAGSVSGAMAFNTRINGGAFQERMRIDKSGNVGIGTTNPDQLLTLSGTATNLLKLYDPTSADTGRSLQIIFTHNSPATSGPRNYAVIGAAVTGSGTGDIYFAPGTAGALNEKMRITSVGNVGIGTTSPAVKLQVMGSVLFSGPSHSTSTAVDGELYYDSTAHAYEYFYAPSSTYVSLGNGNISYTGTLWNQSGSNIYYSNAGGSVAVNASTSASNLGVYGNASIGTGYQGTAAPSNGLIVQGNVGIGTTSPGQRLDIVGSIAIPTTIDSTSGVIYKGTTPFIHNYAGAGSLGQNTFVGLGAGNFTMGTGGGASYLGSTNSATGYLALSSNTTGYFNTANGGSALNTNTTGYFNTANGMQSLVGNTTGYQNTANGGDALYSNTTGFNNSALGFQAGYNGSLPLQTMSNSTFLGYGANSSVDGVTNSTAIGNGAQVTASNQIVLGNGGVTQTLLNGNVGIGTSTPSAKLSVQATNSNATLGSELLTTAADRDFSSASGNWTGTNWSIVGGVATHTVGANPFTHTLVATAGVTYQIVFTVNTTATGTLQVSFGGAVPNQFLGPISVGQSLGTVTAETEVITTSNTGVLTFTPDANWTGTLDNISVKQITFSGIAQNIYNSDGSLALEIRGGGSGGFGSGGGGDNVFIGTGAGRANAAGTANAGTNNTAVGYRAFSSNTTGFQNAAFGQYTLSSNTTGSRNNAFGSQALASNTTGQQNAAFGTWAMNYNTTGSLNTAIGVSVFQNNTTGIGNTALGYLSGMGSGGNSLSTIDNFMTFLGYGASRDASVLTTTALTNGTAIGKNAHVGASNTIVLGGTGVDAVNVGIGTTSPQVLFHVAGKGAFGDSVTTARAGRVLNLISTDAVMRVERLSDTSSPAVELYHDNAAGTNLTQWDFYAAGNNGRNFFSIRNRAPVDGNNVFTADINGGIAIGSYAVTATASLVPPAGGLIIPGNVGIGTTSPGSKLDIWGNLNVATSSTSTLFVNTALSRVGINTSTPASTFVVAANCAGIAGNPGSCSDYAELYPASEDTSAGDVVIIDTSSLTAAVRLSTSSYDSNLLGVISTNPAMVIEGNSVQFMNGDYHNDPRHPAVALAGRVPVKVTNENGNIKPGDYLTSSATHPGYAMKATASGYVIGQALESFDSTTPSPNGATPPVPGGETATGTVLIFIKPMQYTPKVADLLQVGNNTNDQVWLASLVNLNMTNASVFGDIAVTGSLAVQKDLRVGGVIYAASMEANTITAKEKLCVGQTCVTEEQLKAVLKLLDKQGSVAGASTGNPLPPAPVTPEPPSTPNQSSPVPSGTGQANSGSGQADITPPTEAAPATLDPTPPPAPLNQSSNSGSGQADPAPAQ